MMNKILHITLLIVILTPLCIFGAQKDNGLSYKKAIKQIWYCHHSGCNQLYFRYDNFVKHLNTKHAPVIHETTPPPQALPTISFAPQASHAHTAYTSSSSSTISTLTFFCNFPHCGKQYLSKKQLIEHQNTHPDAVVSPVHKRSCSPKTPNSISAIAQTSSNVIPSIHFDEDMSLHPDASTTTQNIPSTTSNANTAENNNSFDHNTIANLILKEHADLASCFIGPFL